MLSFQCEKDVKTELDTQKYLVKRCLQYEKYRHACGCPMVDSALQITSFSGLK